MSRENVKRGSREASGGPAEDGAWRFLESLVAAALGERASDLRSRGRGSAATAFARQAVMYLAHVQLGLSFTQVGRLFGRDRTTVAHACAVIEDRRDDPGLEQVFGCLEAALDRWRSSFLRRVDVP